MEKSIKLDYMLSPKLNLNKFPEVTILLAISSDYKNKTGIYGHASLNKPDPI